jgi:2-keto-4-pentenoate hydratase
MDGPNLLAINVGARMGVVGEAIPVEATEAFAARLGTMTVVMENGERELARAPGTALLGHPLNVLPWLAQDLASRGQRLRAGDLVSLGGFSPACRSRRAHLHRALRGMVAAPVSVSVRTR